MRPGTVGQIRKGRKDPGRGPIADVQPPGDTLGSNRPFFSYDVEGGPQAGFMTVNIRHV